MRPTKFITAAILLLCLTVQGWAATITSTASGHWVDGSTWVGGVAPVSGDLAIIANGHTVDIRTGDTVVVGDPTTAANLAISNVTTGVLSITGGSLTIKSSVLQQGSATWTITGTPVIEYDNASAGTWTIGGAHAQSGRLNITGTDNLNRVTIRSKSGGGKLSFDFSGTAWLQGMLGTIKWCDFTRIGDATHPFWKFYNSSDGGIFSLTFCTMDTCGYLTRQSNLAAQALVTIEDNIWVNSPGDSLQTIGGSTAISGTGVRSLQRNYFDGAVGTGGLGTWGGFTIRHNYLPTFSQISALTTTPAVFEYNLLQFKTATASNIDFDTSASGPNYALIHGSSTINNCRFLALGTLRGVTVAGWIVDPGDTDTTGDFVTLSSPASAYTHTIKNNLFLPNKNGNHAGQVASALGNANVAAAVTHNTWFSDSDTLESGGVSYGETYLGHADIFTAIKSNLVWSGTSGTASIFNRRALRTFSDGAAAANCDYNGKYNAVSGTYSGSVGAARGDGYKDYATSGTFVEMFSSTAGLGAHDVTGNPQFVDSTRNLYKWSEYQSESVPSDTYQQHIDNALALIKADPARWIPDLISYVQDGWRPTNRSFKNAGHDGVTIGALEGVFTNAQGPRNRMKTNGGLRRPARDLLHRGV